MTAFAIIEAIALWGIISTWICYKRDWYKNLGADGLQEFAVVGAYIAMPIYLVLAIVREFCAREWTYHK